MQSMKGRGEKTHTQTHTHRNNLWLWITALPHLQLSVISLSRTQSAGWRNYREQGEEAVKGVTKKTNFTEFKGRKKKIKGKNTMAWKRGEAGYISFLAGVQEIQGEVNYFAVYAAATVRTKIDGLLNLLLTKQGSLARIYISCDRSASKKGTGWLWNTFSKCRI